MTINSAQQAHDRYAQTNAAMARVYGYVTLALLTAAFTSWFVAFTPALMTFFFTGWTVFLTVLLPLLLIFVYFGTIAMVRDTKWEIPSILTVFILFAASMGLSTTAFLIQYDATSVIRAFLSAGILFLTLTTYGLITKRDLTRLGNILVIGVMVLIGVSLINIFIGSTLVHTAISVVTIAVFMGLTATDTQKIRNDIELEGPSIITEISGALSLFLDFLNMFTSILSLTGDSD